MNGGDRFTIGIIGPTGTHPDHRRRGYATLCLRDATRVQEERGWPVAVLWTAEATFPFYWHSGWEAVGSQGFVYALGRGGRELFQSRSHDVVAFDPTEQSHLDFVAAAHDAEPRRIVRSADDYLALLTLPNVSTRLALDGGEPAAYLVVGEGFNKPGLIEGGGDPAGAGGAGAMVARPSGAGPRSPGAGTADELPAGAAHGGPEAGRPAPGRGGRRRRPSDDAGQQRRRADERHSRPSPEPVGGTRRRGVALLPRHGRVGRPDLP